MEQGNPPTAVGSNAGLGSMCVPEPMPGDWHLLAPDGRQFTGETPLKAVRAEMDSRIPPSVQLARVLAAAEEPDFAERHVQLGAFYAAKNADELIDRLNAHVCRLQAKSLHPVARVAEVHMSRYTIEWLGQVFPEGTLLHWARPVADFSFAPQFVRGG